MAAPIDDLLATLRKACLPGIWSQGVKLAREGAVFDRQARADTVTARVRSGAVAPTVTLYPDDGEWTCDCGGKFDPCPHVAATAIAAAQGLAEPPPVAAPSAAGGSGAASGASATAGAGVEGSGGRAGGGVVSTAPGRFETLDAGWSGRGGRGTESVVVREAAPVVRAGGTASAGSAEGPRSAKLRYVLRRQPGGLGLERWLVLPDGREEAVRGPLARVRLTDGATLLPTHEDVTLDRLVGNKQFGYLPAERTPEVFAALGGVSDVRMEQRPVSVSPQLCLPRGQIVDAPNGGVALVLDRDPSVTEVLTAGVVLCGDVLHRLGEMELTGMRLEKLPVRRVFPKADLGQVVTQILPDLGRRFPVEVRTKRLPKAQKGARPRILFQLLQRGHTLSVIPSLVYGDPPQARVENGRLVHLRGATPVRDESGERDLLNRLRAELNLVPGRCVDFDGGEAARFAARLQGWSAREGGEDHRKIFKKTELVPRLVVDDVSIELFFELRRAGTKEDDEDGEVPSGARVDAAAVVKAWQDGLPLVPLAAGGWAPLPGEWMNQHGQRVADLLAAKRDDGTVSPAALPAMSELCDALEMPRPAGLKRLEPLFQGFEAVPEAGLPEDLSATLRPYQRQGVDWLCFLRDAGLGAVLADDMGLGKTLQALCALKGRALVVCPRSVVHNWAAEIQRFRPGLAVSIYHGPKRALDPEADVTLTTYSVLRLDAEELAQVTWGVVVLDEAQIIKNPDSQVARAAYALKADFRMSLSGTPVENRLEELWSQMHFTNRGLLGGFGDFQERFARPIGAGQPDAAARLRQKIRPFVMRRLKREVAPELPPRTDAVLYCELEEGERAVYDAVMAATRKEVVTKLAEGGSVLAALEALLRLRQAACHAALVPGQSASSSSKVERLVEALIDAAADGHKALVFSQWTSLLDLVEPHLEAVGISFARLDGSTRDRAGVVTSFQDPAGPPVLLISLKAGGTGLNLTAADHVFLMDPWWNPAVEDQAADRAHRIGQDRPVMVYRLVAKDTVEEGILGLQEKKRALAGAALGEVEQAAALTREDLLSLLR
ncbi:DEAD/DEAH box helicase [Chondromyces crocatus]|uniref:Helicase n=1 Tax=Chondromyces crocatus TaxID=52 RepID=A0A0K1EQN4_CHOCO|nr:DEAD/DEAH box helicase [Chondromyces crocatus]AKT42967.1 helicase [Chondromyces crocatus]